VIDINPYLKSNIRLKNFKKNRSINQLSKKFEKIFLDLKKEINQDNKTLNILDNKFKFNFKIKDLNKFKKFKNIVLIGMGGSVLGAEAIYNFLQKKIKKKVYFFNNLDEDKVTNLKKNNNLSKFLFIIISKSGNTIETLSNTFYLNIIKNNAKNIILISEKKNNYLYSLSKKFNLFYVEHKNFIGGRFSVLSDVGVLPAYLMGINIKRLRSKILDCLKKKNKTTLKNNVIKLIILNNSKKYNNLIFLNYSRELENFLYWSQQLIAESLGKKSKGFLPVISNVPKDHHSLLQLYLAGPKDKIFYVFHIEKKSKEKINITKNLKIKSFLNKKKLHVIKRAQRLALMKSLDKKSIPFREFQIKKVNEETLGKLFTYFIIETVIVGRLLNINPFNQPAVEQVKVYTKKLLN